MKQHLLPLLTGVCLIACSKSDEQPRGISATFEHDFDLFYKQKAFLDNPTTPELSVKIEHLEYYTTPKGVICCFGPCAGWKATVLVSDAAGNTQTYIRNPYAGNGYANWLDSLHVRANGTTYVVYLKAMKPGLEDQKTKIQHRAVQLVVSRPKSS